MEEDASGARVLRNGMEVVVVDGRVAIQERLDDRIIYGHTLRHAGQARRLAKELQDAADEIDPPSIPVDPTEAEIVT